MNAENTEVVGVKVFQEGEAELELMANLIIDASGAASNTPNWIHQFGYTVPKKSEVNVDLFYASRIYQTLSSNSKNAESVLVYPNPPLFKSGGGIYPIENQRWMVTLFGYGVENIPRTDAEFLEFSKGLSQPDLYELILNAQPENDINVYRFPKLRRYHYERLNRFPNRLIVIGDAYCRIDPVFGQGMSIAALEAIALKKELKNSVHKDNLIQISRKVHHRFSKIIDIPWLIALSEDFRYKHTEGAKPPGLSILMWYVKKVILACADAEDVYFKLIKVLHLKAHPITLFAPTVIKAVLFSRRK